MRRMVAHAKPAAVTARRAKPVGINNFEVAAWCVAKLSKEDLRDIVYPMTAALQALREGLCSHNDWALLAGAMNVAQAIEKGGVVRGLAKYLTSAERALEAFEKACMSTAAWSEGVMPNADFEHVHAAVKFHQYQLLQLSNAELQRALDYAEAEVLSSGGQALRLVNRGRITGLPEAAAL